MHVVRYGTEHSFMQTTFWWHYLSNATCLMRPRLLLRRVKDHHNLLHDSPCLKTTCVRQVVLDNWFPLKHVRC